MTVTIEIQKRKSCPMHWKLLHKLKVAKRSLKWPKSFRAPTPACLAYCTKIILALSFLLQEIIVS